MAGKYALLHKHLRTLEASEWRASFAEIEGVLGADLPASARKHAAWWSNGGHSHAAAWMDAGFETRDLDVPQQTVAFRRTGVDANVRTVPRKRGTVSSTPKPPDYPLDRLLGTSDTAAMSLCGQDFRWVCRIEPDARPDGLPVQYMPQKNYAKASEKPLNRHGHGPFCRFSIPGLPMAPGLYAVTVDQRLAYIGIAKKSLRQRWGASGYAEIQPVNCYRNGQSTNCKINHAILRAAQEKQAVELWIRRDDDPRPLEKRLIRELNPPWNDQR